MRKVAYTTCTSTHGYGKLPKKETWVTRRKQVNACRVKLRGTWAMCADYDGHSLLTLLPPERWKGLHS